MAEKRFFDFTFRISSLCPEPGIPGRWKDFQQLEKGLIQQVDALNLFLNDIYGDKKIIHDGGIPEKLYEGNVISAVLSPTEGIVFFTHKKPLAAENEVICRIIRRLHE